MTFALALRLTDPFPMLPTGGWSPPGANMNGRQICHGTTIRSLMPVNHGVPMVLAITPGDSQAGIVRVYAAIALYRRGLPLLAATAAVDEIIARGRTAVLLPTVEDGDALERELAEAGCAATFGEHADAAMLLRVRSAMDLPPDLPSVIQPDEGTLQ
jgi:hypothetical protein